MGRWTEQRAQEHRDKETMDAIQGFFREEGLPPEASGYQQILLLWRRNIQLKENCAELKRENNQRGTELQNARDLLEVGRASELAIS